LLHDEDLNLNGHPNGYGDHDRALWRPSQDKIQLAPAQINDVFRQIRSRTPSSEYPFYLQSSHSRSYKTDIATIEAHPNCGFEDGQSIELSTRFGKITGTLKHNEALHPSTVACSALDHAGVLDILPTQTDLWSGTPIYNGVACTLSAL
jgi:anaerobic selenocysteine-containing dehydrogenase